MALLKHTLERPDGLLECESVIEVGAGIRPFNWYKPKSYHVIEPYDEYCNVLRENKISYSQGTAFNCLKGVTTGQVILLDVIEHMHKEEAAAVIELAVTAAHKQVVIYTPKGFVEQEGDAWGLGGDYWQKHRSGWLPMEFPGWKIQMHGPGFFAIWNK